MLNKFGPSGSGGAQVQYLDGDFRVISPGTYVRCAITDVRIPLDDNPSIAWLDKHQRPLVSFDVQNDPRLVRSYELFRSLDIRSIALIPLIFGIGELGENIGVGAH